MSGRLSPDAAAALGLVAPPASSRISDTEATDLGLVAPSEHKHKDPGGWRAVGHSFLQGFYKGGSDEAVGGLGSLVQEPGDGAALKMPDGSIQHLKSKGDVYRGLRDIERGVLEGAHEHHPKKAFAADLAGDIASDVVLRVLGVPVGSKAYSVAVGALQGLMRSDSDLTPDKITPESAALAGLSTAVGAGAGAAGHWLGEKVIGPGAKYVGNKLSRLGPLGARKVAETEQRAAAMGTARAAEETAKARSHAGGESTRAANIAKTLLAVETPDMPRSAGAYAEFLEHSAERAAKQAAEMAEKAKAAPALDEMLRADPDFAAKPGSKLSKARQAGDWASFYEKAAEDLRQQAAKVRETGEVPKAAFEAARARALASPEFAELRGNVLENLLVDLPGEAARSKAAREAARFAAETEGERATQHTADLLSGKAAKDALMARVKRYGPPLAASIAGSALGGPAGAGVGLAVGWAAGRGMEALGGAGMRPAVRSFINLVTKYPAVSARVWKAVQKVGNTHPERLGEFAPMLASAAARGYAPQKAHEFLLENFPAYAELVMELDQEEAGPMDADKLDTLLKKKERK